MDKRIVVHTDEYNGPDRRSDHIAASLGMLTAKMESVESKISYVERHLEEKIEGSKLDAGYKMRTHEDASNKDIEQLRDADINLHRDMNERASNIDKRISKAEARIDFCEEEIEDLKEVPIVNKAKKWDKQWVWILGVANVVFLSIIGMLISKIF